jgi:hypothetical protein
MPEQFFKLTPMELFEMADSKKKFDDADRTYHLQELGQLAAWLLSPYTKEELTYEDFVKPPKKESTKEEVINDLKDMVGDFGLKGGNSDWLLMQD